MSNPRSRTAANLRQPTRLACGLIPLFNLLRSRGADIDEILAPIGIGKAEFLDPAFTIALEQELTIVEKALHYLPEPEAPLELARLYHLHNLFVLGLAIRSCATVGDSFELIRQFPRLQWGICQTSGSVNGDTLTFQLSAGETRAEQFLLMRDIACIKTLFGELLNDDLYLQQVNLASKKPANSDQWETLFNCPVRFGKPITCLDIPLTELDRPIPTADPLSCDFYVAQCARISAQMDEPFRYSWLIRDHLLHSTPIPHLESLADKLHIEPRTLQRRLKKEGKSFSEILKNVRLKRSKERLLYSDLTLEQIANELGFADAVAFSHAFKQWTGQPPRQWRQKYISSASQR